jgi:hypothetical protein
MMMPSSDVVAVPAFHDKQGLGMKRARATEDIRVGSLRIKVSRILAAVPELAHNFGIRQGKSIHQAKRGMALPRAVP